MKKLKPKHVLLLVAAAVWVHFYLQDSDEKRVRKQFDRLAECVTKPAGEQSVMMAAKMHNLGSVFADTCYFEAPRAMMTNNYTPEAVASHAARARSQFAHVKLSFHDLGIRFLEEGKATATLTARLTGTMKSDRAFEETHELDCTLTKREDDWVISKVVVVEVLER